MINQHTKDLEQVKDALIGKDLCGGIVAEIGKLKTFMKIAVFISGASITAAIALILKVIFNV